MTMYECKKCEKALNEKNSWYLKFMGFFCRECALYVVSYWMINADSVLEKIQKDK